MTSTTAEDLTAESFSNSLGQGGYINLSARPKFRLSGSDRVRFLSGQVTQAVSDVTELQTLYSCITNHKGKMEGDLFISSGDDFQSFVLDTHPELHQSLFSRLDRYIIADDVELTDITDDWQLIHVIGQHEVASEQSARRANRYGVDGTDYWLRPGDDISTVLRGLAELDPRVLEILRISNGIGEWGRELTSDILPPEARVESRAISYTKGCYIGQEVISRIRSVGKVNRTLERTDWVEGAPLSAGMRLVDGQGDKVGHVTSVAYHPAHPDGARWIALAFVKKGSSELGSRLTAIMPSPQDEQIVLSSEVEVRNTPNHQDA